MIVALVAVVVMAGAVRRGALLLRVAPSGLASGASLLLGGRVAAKALNQTRETRRSKQATKKNGRALFGTEPRAFYTPVVVMHQSCDGELNTNPPAPFQ